MDAGAAGTRTGCALLPSAQVYVGAKSGTVRREMRYVFPRYK